MIGTAPGDSPPPWRAVGLGSRLMIFTQILTCLDLLVVLVEFQSSGDCKQSVSEFVRRFDRKCSHTSGSLGISMYLHMFPNFLALTFEFLGSNFRRGPKRAEGRLKGAELHSHAPSLPEEGRNSCSGNRCPSNDESTKTTKAKSV